MLSIKRWRLHFNYDEIPSNHHDVVLYGLYSDYLQHNNSGLIDELTCDLKVNYLSENKKQPIFWSYDQKQNNCNEIKLNIFKKPRSISGFFI